VRSVEVNFEARTATVSMESGKSLSREDCERALKGSIYSVQSFEEVATGAGGP